jgi:hypothetical protein
MRHHRIAVVAILAGSVATAWAQPGHHHKSKHKKAPKHEAAVVDDDDDDVVVVDEVAFAPPDDSETIEPSELVDAPVRVHTLGAPAQKDWHVSFGPYLWASSVDANVTVGQTSVGSGVDFSQLEQHAKYGIELVSEARYGKVSLEGNLLYGVIGLSGGMDVGPLTVNVSGEASSLLLDSLGGYTIYGDDHSVFAIEGRGGFRYQRTAISASIGVAGAAVETPAKILGGTDAIAGTRVFVRPWSRLFFTGSADIGVFGSSSSTWSVEADASVGITSHVQLSLGYRTLTLDGSAVGVVMHGPRAALQMLF